MSTYKEDYFMKTFKYYKSKNPNPTLDKVLFVQTSDNKVLEDSSFSKEWIDPRAEILGLHCPSKWEITYIDKHPGLIFIKNPFTSLGQRHWIRICLEEYTKKPNKTNIDVEDYIEDWWLECFRNGRTDVNLQKKLRWTTLGYHHDWDTKVYSERNKNDFPPDLSELCDIVSSKLNFTNFRAEAAIVNYYHMGSTLSAHTDHSEVNLTAPLFSFSFGQSAIFLIGGQSKSTEPTAIMLNSGDIVVMSKEARLCYHAVPRILPAPSQPWNDVNGLNVMKNKEPNLKYTKSGHLLSKLNRNVNNECWSEYCKYVENSRININVRQVLNNDDKSL